MSNLPTKTSLITGGAGFIGSHLIDYLCSLNEQVIVIDSLGYAANVSYLKAVENAGRIIFYECDINNTKKVLSILKNHHVTTIYHLAAESHVDRSIEESSAFIQTNIVGTYSMLTASLQYWEEAKDPAFRFVHVSTDEVFGHLTEEADPFTENSPYQPNSPYSASKAASDHLVHAWYKTYGLPAIITNCSNNYGPRQHTEKLIPTIIYRALSQKPIPIYGTGRNIRDWIYVKDHCKGLYLAAQKGHSGQQYCFGGMNEKRNIDLANEICSLLDKLCPREDDQSYRKQIQLVEDRKGHDWRYAIDIQKAQHQLGFTPESRFRENLVETIQSYLIPSIEESLYSAKNINLEKIHLNFEGFKKLAINPHLQPEEKIGFPTHYRQGFESHIAQDIERKFNHLLKTNGTLLDIGCGASRLTTTLLERFHTKKIHTVLNDSQEMLANIKTSLPFQKVAGKFPDCLDELLSLYPDGYDYILCYSVLHYIMIDTNLFNFLDAILQALKVGGVALIGDIPNISKRKRFFSSETGIAFHKEFMNTAETPVVEFLKIEKEKIDDAVLNSLVDRARLSGFDAYLIPQNPSLPMSNRRDDLIIIRP